MLRFIALALYTAISNVMSVMMLLAGANVYASQCAYILVAAMPSFHCASSTNSVNNIVEVDHYYAFAKVTYHFDNRLLHDQLKNKNILSSKTVTVKISPDEGTNICLPVSRIMSYNRVKHIRNVLSYIRCENCRHWEADNGAERSHLKVLCSTGLIPDETKHHRQDYGKAKDAISRQQYVLFKTAAMITTAITGTDNKRVSIFLPDGSGAHYFAIVVAEISNRKRMMKY